MIELRDNFFAVELTNLGDHFKSFKILEPDKKWTVPYVKYSYRSIYHTKNRGKDFYCSEEDPLEPGTWQIICTLKDATYTQAAEIIERDGDGFNDYDEDNFHHDLPFMSPFESLRSLLTVRGCDVNKNWLIIKKG